MITIGDGATINGNLFTGAQTVSMNGKVTGSVFTGVMSLVLNENSVVGRIFISEDTAWKPNKDQSLVVTLAAGGYQVILSGDVSRDVKAGVAAFKLDGSMAVTLISRWKNPELPRDHLYSGPWSPQTGNIEMIHLRMDIGEGASISAVTWSIRVPGDQTSGMQSTPQGTVVFQTFVPDETTTRQPTRNIRFDLVILKALWTSHIII